MQIFEVIDLGISAYKVGNLAEADRCYTAVLRAQPDHPECNYLMGILAVDYQEGKSALGFFRKALKIEPKNEKYWSG